MQPELRSTPAFEITAAEGAVWRGLMCALSCAAVASMLAWLASHLAAAAAVQDEAAVWIGAGVLALMLMPMTARLVWRARRASPSKLRWDGQSWWLVEPGTGADPLPVQLRVAMDFGDWLLLRLQPASLGQRWHQRVLSLLAPRYLQVGREGAGAAWTLLRTTVFGAMTKVSRARDAA